MEIWQIRLKKADGSFANHFDSFTLTRRVNSPGAYALRLDGNDPKVGLFELDGQLEFWWTDPDNDIDWHVEFEAFHRTSNYYITADGALFFESSGRGYIDLLNRRIVAAAAGSSGARKSGAAETVIKAFVNEQCGPGAGSRAISGLSIEADGGGGNTVRLSRAYRKVLEVCQDIAKIGGGDFDIIGTGAAQFEFRWYDDQRGTDRTTTVIFSLERGNMAKPRLYHPRADEVNAVLVGGQGAGSDRTTAWRTDATLIDDSPLNRIEAFVDARNEDQTDGLNAKGDMLLDEKKPRQRLEFEVLQTPSCMYGKHYFLGDLVTAKFLDFEETKKVIAVTITLNKEGRQTTVEMVSV